MQEDAMLKAFGKQVPFSEVNTLSTLMLAGDEEPEAPKEAVVAKSDEPANL